jgi:hypothetical protein
MRPPGYVRGNIKGIAAEVSVRALSNQYPFGNAARFTEDITTTAPASAVEKLSNKVGAGAPHSRLFLRLLLSVALLKIDPRLSGAKRA